MSDGKLRYIASSMDAKLPYTLTKGVTATREGLVIEWGNPIVTFFNDARKDLGMSQWTVAWPDAAERVRYREGEPWCCYDERNNGLLCDKSILAYHGAPSYLHRIAAILCDDAEAFRVLHWCVTIFGQENEHG